jgi:hypothetical protein
VLFEVCAEILEGTLDGLHGPWSQGAVGIADRTDELDLALEGIQVLGDAATVLDIVQHLR